MDAVCLKSLADFGSAALPVMAPGELADRVAAWQRGELGEADARRTRHDVGLIAALVRRESGQLAARGEPVDAVAEAEEEVHDYPEDDDEGGADALADVARLGQAVRVVDLAVCL